jgi:hypothetical protein
MKYIVFALIFITVLRADTFFLENPVQSVAGDTNSITNPSINASTNSSSQIEGSNISNENVLSNPQEFNPPVDSTASANTAVPQQQIEFAGHASKPAPEFTLLDSGEFVKTSDYTIIYEPEPTPAPILGPKRLLNDQDPEADDSDVRWRRHYREKKFHHGPQEKPTQEDNEVFEEIRLYNERNNEDSSNKQPEFLPDLNVDSDDSIIMAILFCCAIAGIVFSIFLIICIGDSRKNRFERDMEESRKNLFVEQMPTSLLV